MSSKKDNTVKDFKLYWFCWLPGFSVGIASTITGFPLDTLKTRMQTGMYPNLLVCIKQTYINDGFCGFYRGALFPLIAMSIRRGYQYPIFESIKKNMIENGNNTVFSNYMAGTITGFTGSFIACPAHVIKVQSQDSHKTQIKNGIDCAKNVIQNKGYWGFYQGFRWQFIKDATFGGLFLGTYGLCKSHLKKMKENDELFLGLSLHQKWNWIFTGAGAGCVSSLFTWIILFPIDTIKTAYQSQHGQEIMIEKMKNPLYFWKGISPVILRSVPVSLTSIFTYEVVSWFVNH